MLTKNSLITGIKQHCKKITKTLGNVTAEELLNVDSSKRAKEK